MIGRGDFVSQWSQRILHRCDAVFGKYDDKNLFAIDEGRKKLGRNLLGCFNSERLVNFKI
jgi:hypothetical protein